MDYKTIFKVTTGIIIVPIGIAASSLWPWWSKQNTPVKILSGFFVLPFVTVAGLLSNWWGNY